MATVRGLSTHDKRFLAGIVHQVWRHCQIFVAVCVERGPEEAYYALEELAEWAVSHRRRLSPRSAHRPHLVSASALRIGRVLLDDIDTFCHGVGDLLARVQYSPLDPDEVEEEALKIIEGFITWSADMATQMGVSRNLRPETLWFER
ncbi:MAG: hypothetical protein HY660_15565 [Armatimonadetes bacterium]|nr:hypothetical protein [Armatimonadota bacterium]